MSIVNLSAKAVRDVLKSDLIHLQSQLKEYDDRSEGKIFGQNSDLYGAYCYIGVILSHLKSS